MSSRAWLLVVLLSACTTPNPRSCLDGVCDDPRYPFCDVNGDIAGAPNTCIEGQCEPNQIAGCQDDDLVTCNANGTNFETSSCDFGCQGTDAQASCNLCEPNTTSCDGDRINHCGTDGRVQSVEECVGTCIADPTARCTHIVPRYLPNVCDQLATDEELVITNSATFDTNLDSNCNGGIILQGGGPAICVVRYRKIVLASGVDLTVTGARALALVSDHETSINGYLDLSAGNGVNGPGGGTIFSGGPAPVTGDGLGGAGFFTVGGAGGNATMNGGANNGGMAMADPAGLAILIGGPQVGNAGLNLGAGGGAATLVACRGTVNVPGEVNAAGGGGVGSFFAGIAVLPGCGGGAGGYVVFQGLAVSLTGKLFANGGGGGAGKTPAQDHGDPGFEGARTTTSASGGLAPSDGSAGGNGGAINSPPGNGRKVGTAGGTAGGGGGSAGFFQTYTPVGVDPVVTPSMASPMPRPNANIPTH